MSDELKQALQQAVSDLGATYKAISQHGGPEVGIGQFRRLDRMRELATAPAEPVPAIPPMPMDIRQQAINRTCIDGHLNSALDAVMRSNSPDGTFCILGALATAAIDIALELAAAPPSPVPQDVRDAQRYRWLRNQSQYGTHHDPFVSVGECEHTTIYVGEELDAAIDAAIAAQDAGKGEAK